MAQRVNKRLVVGLTIAAMAITAATAVVLVRALPEPDPDVMAESGRKLIAAGKIEEGLRRLLDAGKQKGAAKHLIEAGDVFLSQGDAATARRTWENAVGREPTLIEAHHRIVELSLELARSQPIPEAWRRLLGDAERLLEIEAESAVGWHARGFARFQLRGEDATYLKGAGEDLEAAVAASPDEPEYSLRLAAYYLHTTGTEGPSEAAKEKADAVYHELLKAAPEDSRALRYYADHLLVQGRPDEALAQLEEAVRAAPEDADAQGALGTYWVGQKQFDAAREAYEKAIALDPDGYAAYLQLGKVYRTQQEAAKALEVYDRRLARGAPKRQGYKAYLNRMQHFGILLAAGTAAVQEAHGVTDTSQRDALLERADQYLSDAVSEVGERPTTHILRGRIAELRGQDLAAIKAFEMALASSRRPLPVAATNLAVLYVKQNQLGEAEKRLKEVTARVRPTESGPAWVAVAWIQLADVQNKLNHPEEAIRTVDQVLAADADHQEALQVKLQALQRRANAYPPGALRDDLLAQAKRIMNQLGVGAGIDQKRNELAQKLIDGKVDENAEALMRGILAGDPADIRVLRLLVAHYLQTGRHADARTVVQAAQTAKPDDRDIKIVKRLLEIATASDTTDEQREKMRRDLVIETIEDPFDRALAVAAYALQRGDVAEAQAEFDAAERLEPDARKVIEQQFLLARHEKDWIRAERYVQRCVELNLDQAGGRTFRGRLHLARADAAQASKDSAAVVKELESAVSELLRALEAYPTSSETQTWLASAYRGLRRPEAAREALDEALRLNPNNGAAHKMAAQMAYARGNDADWATHLAAATRTLPRDPWVRNMQLLLAERRDPRAAIERREERRQAAPDDLANLLRLLDLYLQVAASDRSVLPQAKRAAEETRRLAPDDLSVLTRAASLFRRLGDGETGKSMIVEWIRDHDDVAKKVEGQLLLGQFLGTQDLGDEAERAYQGALALEESLRTCRAMAEWLRQTGRVADSMAWYDKAIDKAGDPAQKQGMRARAIEVSFNGGLLDVTARQITAFRKAWPDDPRGLLAEGSLRMRQGLTTEAMAAFDALLEKDDDNASGYFRRGTLYFRQSLWPRCIRDLEKAATLQPDGFGYAHRILLARARELSGQPDVAVSELNAIRAERPGATAVVHALVDLYGRLESWSLAHRVLVEYSNREPDNPTWALRRAQVAERLKLRDEALGSYHRAAERSHFSPSSTDALLAAMLRFEQWDAVIRFVGSQLPEEKRGPIVQQRLATAYARKGDLASAAAAMQRAAGGTLSLSRLRVLAMDLERIHGRAKATAWVAEQAAANEGVRAWKLLRLALLVQQSDPAPAIALAETLLATAASDAERLVLHQLRGDSLYQTGDFESARDAYRESLELNPDDMVAMNNLAYVLAESLEKPAEALPYAERVAALAPQDANAMDTLGWTHFLLGDTDAAIGRLLQAIQNDATLVAPHYHIGMAYEKRGDRANALRELRIAVDLGQKQNETNFAPKAADTLRQLEEN